MLETPIEIKPILSKLYPFSLIYFSNSPKLNIPSVIYNVSVFPKEWYMVNSPECHPYPNIILVTSFVFSISPFNEL